ncbi:hypothetical protein [Cyclobacterium sp.]|uniref:hypothetical protein n=1 Tax=Cyclobacterium sp. TaxID=1966343 RepID=UPI0019A50E56|nr:hypothetical protein [Cyclobacterium sp.]MBD3627641.1 hypothetical protein [Cyclobacterium sp.]
MPKLKPNQFYLSGHLITERPILFQTKMVQANLEDRKTQTRRTIGLNRFNADPIFWNRKDDPRKSINRFYNGSEEVNPNPLEIYFGFTEPLGETEYVKSPYGKPGDLLWVRETWAKVLDTDSNPFYAHKADSLFFVDRWKPSIHMPKSAARLWLMVEDIRVERVQDITEKDAIAEGVSTLFLKGNIHYDPNTFLNYTWHGMGGDDSFSGYSSTGNARESFQSLWYKINGKSSWKSNPWVWVIQYRILSKTGRPSDDTILENYLQITGKGKEVSHE